MEYCVSILDLCSSNSFLQEIPNTGLFAAVQYGYDGTAGLEIFHIFQKKQVKKIYRRATLTRGGYSEN